MDKIAALDAGADAGYEDLHMLRVNISNLRHKIEADPARPAHLVTEPGVGYRLRVAEDRVR